MSHVINGQVRCYMFLLISYTKNAFSAIALLVLQHTCYCLADITMHAISSQTFCQPFVEY